jgi:acetyltransferase-like isoleucine patch superfamily enzyme
MMKAYVVQSDKVIEPFGDHPRDCLIANRKLSDIQGEVLQSLGMEVRSAPGAAQIDDPGEHIVLEDSLFFTSELLQKFIAESRRHRSSGVCALKPGRVTRSTMVPTQDVRILDDRVEYGLLYQPSHESRGEVDPVVIDPEQFSERVPLPEHIRGGSELRIPVTDTMIIQVDHWANLWAANIGTLLAEAARLRNAPRSHLLRLILQARSLNKWKVLKRLNRVGKNCDIHPTAYIEGSTIGDNVTVGAGSVIRLSFIGDGTAIGSNATVECSVVGNRCALDSMSGAFGSVLYPGTATSAKLIYLSLCGRNSFLADGVYLSDFRFDGKNVTVMKGGAAIDAGNVGLGVCLGHGVYLGAGCVIAPGRAVPNGIRLVPDEIRTISKFNADGSAPGHKTVDADGA